MLAPGNYFVERFGFTLAKSFQVDFPSSFCSGAARHQYQAKKKKKWNEQKETTAQELNFSIFPLPK